MINTDIQKYIQERMRVNTWWTTHEIEKCLYVSCGTCGRWIREGKLKALKTSKNGHYRIEPDEVIRFLKERGVLEEDFK